MEIYEPPYFQSEANYKLSKEPAFSPWAHQMLNVCAGAVPLISHDRSLIYPLAIGAGTLRVVAFYQEARYYHAAAAAASLALTVFSHPVGMLVITAHDIFLGCQELTHVGGRQDQLLCITKIFKNILYLSLFFHPGAGLALASLSLQMGLHIYTAFQQKEWQNTFMYLGLAVVSVALCKNILEQKREKVYRIQPFPYPIPSCI